MLGGYICRVMFAASCFSGSWVFPLKLLFWSIQSKAEYIFSFHLQIQVNNQVPCTIRSKNRNSYMVATPRSSNRDHR